MLRTVLLILALVVLIGIGLVWTGVINMQSTADGGVKVTANPVEVGIEQKEVTVPVPVVRTGNSAAPAPAAPAPAPATAPAPTPAP